ncbi:uncharacterized protein LOC144179614 isoform X1 [Haemaphysalis longicornis]
MFLVCGWLLLRLVSLSLIFDIGCSEPANMTFCDKSFVSVETDCSFMLNQAASCILHHTNSCRTYDYSSWNMEPEHVVTSLDDLDYRVSLSTFNHRNEVALNVSFVSTSPEVLGFHLSIVEHKFPKAASRYETCRLFDLRNSTARQSVHVFYDCYFKIQGDYKNSDFFFTSSSLPTNRVGRFFIRLAVPPVNETVCEWPTTVMVLEPALPKSTVVAQFGLANDTYNITRYRVSLVKDDSKAVIEEKTVTAASVGEPTMTDVSFKKVPAGAYFLRIHPDHPDWYAGHSCHVSTSDVFTIPPDHKAKLAVSVSLACGLALLLFLSAVLLLYVYIRRRSRPLYPSPTVFLLYSYDSAAHFEAVQALQRFLSEVPGVRVVFDVAEANDMGAPHHWLPAWLRRADHILLVVSDGVYDKIEKQRRPQHEHHPWGDLVTPAVYDIVRLEELQQKLVKVVMSGTPETKVPTSLFTRGTTFRLPKHSARLLHHLFGQLCHSVIQCRARHPEWPLPDSERALRKALEKFELSRGT